MTDLPLPQPAAGETHLWLLPVVPENAFYRTLLSDDEHAKAARFLVDSPRDQFIAARGALRYLTGRYLHRSPHDMHFEYGAHGKPSLAPEFSGILRFNVAHSHGLALIGFSGRCEIGVDIEYAEERRYEEAVAEMIFPPEEFGRFRMLGEQERRFAFFQHWTITEAKLKALGEGIAAGLEPAQRLDCPVASLLPEPGYFAAIAWLLKPPCRIPVIQCRSLTIEDGNARIQSVVPLRITASLTREQL